MIPIVKAAIPLPFRDFVGVLHEWLRAVRRELNGADPQTRPHKLATSHAWMASPRKPSTERGPPHLLPRYLQLVLSRHLLCNIACFRLRAHTLRLDVGKFTIGTVAYVTCMSRQISAAARSVLHCVFSRLELVG